MVHPRPKGWKRGMQVSLISLLLYFFFLLEPTKPFLLLQNSHPFCFVSYLTGTPILALSLRQQNAQRLGTAPACCLSVVLVVVDCTPDPCLSSRIKKRLQGSMDNTGIALVECPLCCFKEKQSAPHTVLCCARCRLRPGTAASFSWETPLRPERFHYEDTELSARVVEKFSERFSVSVVVSLLLFIFYRFLLSNLNSMKKKVHTRSQFDSHDWTWDLHVFLEVLWIFFQRCINS